MTRQHDANSEITAVFDEALERHGVLDGELLYDEFADPTHPLHAHLEWNDKVAGKAYRVGQINRLIRVCYFSFVNADDEEVRVRRFTPVRYTGDTERLRGYTRTDQVAQNPLQAKALLREYRRWLKQGEQRFANLQEFIALMQGGQEDTG